MPQLSSLLPLLPESPLWILVHPSVLLWLLTSMLSSFPFILPFSFLFPSFLPYFLPSLENIDHHHQHYHRHPLVDVDRRGEGAEATTTRCWLLMLYATGLSLSAWPMNYVYSASPCFAVAMRLRAWRDAMWEWNLLQFHSVEYPSTSNKISVHFIQPEPTPTREQMCLSLAKCIACFFYTQDFVFTNL